MIRITTPPATQALPHCSSAGRHGLRVERVSRSRRSCCLYGVEIKRRCRPPSSPFSRSSTEPRPKRWTELTDDRRRGCPRLRRQVDIVHLFLRLEPRHHRIQRRRRPQCRRFRCTRRRRPRRQPGAGCGGSAAHRQGRCKFRSGDAAGRHFRYHVGAGHDGTCPGPDRGRACRRALLRRVMATATRSSIDVNQSKLASQGFTVADLRWRLHRSLSIAGRLDHHDQPGPYRARPTTTPEDFENIIIGGTTRTATPPSRSAPTSARPRCTGRQNGIARHHSGAEHAGYLDRR